MNDPLIPLAALVAEGLGASVASGPNITTLAGRLGDAVELDDLGRRCVSRDLARSLLAEHAALQASLRRVPVQHAESEHEAAVRRGRAARAARQRQILQENPEMDALLLARLCNGDVDRQLDRQSRIRDAYAAAERDGQIGFGRFGKIPNGGH